MTFRELPVGRLFYFADYPNILHEKTSEDTARELSSVKATKPFKVQPAAAISTAPKLT